jgi:hypothetical protein
MVNTAKTKDLEGERDFQNEVADDGEAMLDSMYDLSKKIEGSRFHPDIDVEKFYRARRLFAEAFDMDGESIEDEDDEEEDDDG